MFSRDFWRQQGAKSKHLFKMWVQVVQVSPALLGYLHCVRLGMSVVFRGFRTCLNAGSGILVVCSLPLSALSLCLWCVACKYGSISRFKGVFSVVWGCCVGLCGSCGLRGLWGFCVREWLGGFVACGVFAFLLSFCPFAFLLLLLCLPPFMLVVLLCSGCLSLFSCIVFVALWVWLLFPFPFRTIRKKKGRAVLVRPLFVCGLLY